MAQQQKSTKLRNGRRGFEAQASTGLGAAAAAQVELTKPEPPEPDEISLEVLTQAAIIGMALVVTIVALYFARSIVMPVLAATIIGITLHPIQKRLTEFRVPPVVTALLLVVLLFVVIYGIAALIIGPLTQWLAETPDLGALVKEKFRWLERPLSTIRDLTKSMGDAGAASNNTTVTVEASVPAMIRSAIGILTPAATEFLVFFGTLLFFLVGIDRLRRQLIVFFESRDARLRVVRIWSDIEQNLITYVGTVTMINLGLGAVTALMLFLLGFPNPLAFGVLAFVLNYIPYIGPAILVATLFGVGLIVTPSLTSAIAPPLLFVAITTIEGHFLTPGIVGRRLTLSPFLVFLALAFWTWLWGPFGAFLATPLLIIGLVLLSHLFPREETSLPG